MHVAVVGAGLVGAVNACMLAKRGFIVDLYELRPDIRRQEVVRGRSINLALSRRGRDALKFIGLEDTVVKNGIPMYARMIHDLDGTRRPIPYGTRDQYIMSVDRRKLNELLIEAAEKHPNVNLHFEHKVVSCDFETGECLFEKPSGEQVSTQVDLIVGTDGAYSSVRKQIMKSTRFDFSQEYIPHGYLELSIPADKNGQFAMETNFLHIWARNTFMLIALPNTEDNSFVVTLFMPFAIFESIQTVEDLLRFFETKFPDAIPLIGKDKLAEDFFKIKPLPLVSIKCSPYHVGEQAVIMGDAAHAMVPFYGQGMNSGMEDCLVFNDLLDRYDNDLAQVLPAFSEERGPDAKAICDLAMYNYIEMRASVNSRLYLLRKKVDGLLNRLLPNTWVPLYTMVSFTRTRYRDCITNKQWQDKILNRVVSVLGMAIILGGTALTWRWMKLHPDNIFQQFLADQNGVLSPITNTINKWVS